MDQLLADYQPVQHRARSQAHRTSSPATQSQQRATFHGEVALFLSLAVLLLLAWRLGPWAQSGLPVPVLSGFDAIDYPPSLGGSAAAVASWEHGNNLTPLPGNIPGMGTGDSVVGPPTITVIQIQHVLTSYTSPATPYAQQLYDLGVQYGIDPAYALAFFIHESDCGTTGVARYTLSLGNTKWTPGWPQSFEGFRQYTSWPQGFEDWYRLIRNLYVAQWKLDTVAKIIPVYAPASDNNDVQAYIDDVQSLVASWRAGANS